MHARKRHAHSPSSSILMALLPVVFLLVSCQSEEERGWEAASAEHTVAAYEGFLAGFPDGVLAENARLGIETIHLGETTVVGTIESYEAFLRQHSGGHFSDSVGVLLEASYFARAIDLEGVDAFLGYMDRFPGGIHADTVQSILEEIFPPFSTDAVMEIQAISGVVGTGDCTFSEGTSPNSLMVAMNLTAPVVNGHTCTCCGRIVKIGPNLRVPLPGFFESEKPWTLSIPGMSGTPVVSAVENHSTFDGVPVEGDMFIVAGPEGATLQKVGRGFKLIEGQANLLGGGGEE